MYVYDSNIIRTITFFLLKTITLLVDGKKGYNGFFFILWVIKEHKNDKLDVVVRTVFFLFQRRVWTFKICVCIHVYVFSGRYLSRVRKGSLFSYSFIRFGEIDFHQSICVFFENTSCLWTTKRNLFYVSLAKMSWSYSSSRWKGRKVCHRQRLCH